jgi:hypothetical protein
MKMSYLNRSDRWSDYRKCRTMWKFVEKTSLGKFLNPSMQYSVSYTKLVAHLGLGIGKFVVFRPFQTLVCARARKTKL